MYVEEMERLQTEGGAGGFKDGEGEGMMGSINAIVFSCGSVALYLTGVDVQRWLAGSPPRKEAEQTSPPPPCSPAKLPPPFPC